MKPIRRTRSDTTRKEIVDALKKIGCLVYDIGHPCDLLVWYRGQWSTIECKTASKSGNFKPRKDQQEQTDFCALTSTPYITSGADALEYICKRWAKLL